MDTVLKFDKVVLVKELNDKFKKVGEVFEIANILDDSFLLRDTKTRVAIGVVSFSDFEKYFVHKENFKGWTSWTQFIGYDGHSDCFYRTNHRKVQVKFVTDNVKAESYCCKGDVFNLSFGIQLAYLRCINKAKAKKTYKLQEEIYKLDREILDNIRTERKMINSLVASNEVV